MYLWLGVFTVGEAYITKDMATVEGETYTLTFNVLSGGTNNNVLFGLVEGDVNDYNPFVSETLSANGVHTYTFTARSEVTSIYFNNTISIDDVKLAKVAYKATIGYFADYYPFGMSLDAAGEQYRFGYQGEYSEDETEETGYNSFQLRLYDPVIGRWISIDPERQYASPYVGMGNNPINGADPTGGETNSPIYSYEGTFLGTDDQGLQGDAILMNASDFTQGMSHQDALTAGVLFSDFSQSFHAWDAINDHYNNLSTRPDYDGYLTKGEADLWYKNNSGEALFVDISQIELTFVDVESFKRNNHRVINFVWYLNNTGQVYGKLSVTLLDPNTGQVSIGYRNPNVSPNGLVLDRYGFEMQDGIKNWIRNFATYVGEPSGGGTSFDIHGYGQALIPQRVIKPGMQPGGLVGH